jgi:hypothetical protein
MGSRRFDQSGLELLDDTEVIRLTGIRTYRRMHCRRGACDTQRQQQEQ